MYCRYEREKEADKARPADWMWPGRGERERIVELVITRGRRTKKGEQERKNSEKNGGRGNTLVGEDASVDLWY